MAVDGSTVTLTLATPAVFGQDGDADLHGAGVEPAAGPLRQPRRGADEPSGDQRDDRAAGGVDRGGAPEGGAVAGRCGVPAVGVAGPGGGPRGHALIAQAGAYLASTEQTVTIPAGATSATGTFPIADDYSLASGGLTATVTGGGRLYVPAPAPANAATVQVVVVNPPIVAQWAENQYEVAEGEDATATLTLKTAAGMPKVPKPRADYKVRVFTTNHTAVAGDDYTAVSGPS